jgi:hypothetical protein
MIKISSDLNVHLKALNRMRDHFPALAYEVLRERRDLLEYQVLRKWPKRGDPGHPWATGASALGMQVKKTKRGLRVFNKERYWTFVGKRKNRRFTGIAYTLIPGLVGNMYDQIVEDLTDALVVALKVED